MSLKTVFITGGTRGIGKSIAEKYHAEGYEIVAPRREELDLSDLQSVTSYLKKHESLRVDVLVNNAGENKVNLLENIILEDWARMLNTNLTSAFLLTQAFSKGMRERRWGRIVNISSSFSLVSKAGRLAYTTTKSGLNGMTRSAAIELAPFNVLVNAVCPGFVETDLTKKNNSPEQIKGLQGITPMGRLAEPREIAELAYFLGSEKNTFTTGQAVICDGGFTLL